MAMSLPVYEPCSCDPSCGVRLIYPSRPQRIYFPQRRFGTSRKHNSKMATPRPTTTTTNTIASSCLSDNEDFPYRRHQPGKLKRLSSD
jgi:hypothetical protein